MASAARRIESERRTGGPPPGSSGMANQPRGGVEPETGRGTLYDRAMNHRILIVAALALGLSACEKEQPASPPLKPPAAQPSVPSTPPAQPAPSADGRVTAAGLSFPVPQGWQSVTPSNSMRLAELHVPDASGDAALLCVVAFSTAGGEVEANITRWAGQVVNEAGQPAAPVVTTREVAGMKVTIAELTGTYSGMSETPKAAWMLRGAIVEIPGTLLFVKMTGPAKQMGEQGAAFNAMIDGMQAK